MIAYSFVMMTYITVTQAAKKMNVSRARIHELIQQGRIPVIRAGAQYMIRPADIDNFEKRRPGRPRKVKEPKKPGKPGRPRKSGK
jgi:excisionase family DNA binding protein